MGNLRGLQIYKYKAFQYEIVENQVNEVVLLLGVDMLLPRHEGIALAKFHQEFLDVVQNGCFQFRLGEVSVLAHAEEFGNDGVLDEFKAILQRTCDFQHLLLNHILVLGHQHPLVVLRRNVPLEGTVAPGLLRSLVQIPFPCL